MDKQNDYSFNLFIYVAAVLVIIRHIVQIVTNVTWLSVSYNPVLMYEIAKGIIMIAIIVLILLKKKYALYAFYFLQLINGIVLSCFDGNWAVNLTVSLVMSLIMTAVLFLKKDGVTGWQAILSSDNQLKPEFISSPIAEVKKQDPISDGSAPIPVMEKLKRETAQKKDPTLGPQPSEGVEPQQNKINVNYIPYIVAFAAIIAGALYMGIRSQNKTEKKRDYSKFIVNVPLGKHVYVDKGDIIHTKRDCKAIFTKNNAQSIDIVPVNYVWIPNSGLENICSKCINERQIEQLDSITSSIAYNNRKWLYQKLIDVYDDVNEWKSFNVYLDDPENRKALYEEIKDKYDLGTFENFDNNMINYREK